MTYLISLFSFLFGVLEAHSYEEKPIIVLITSYNNRRWVPRNVESVFNQDYTNYRVIYVDDASRDATADLTEYWVNKQSKSLRFDIVRNAERIGALANIYRTIYNSCADEEIVVSLDGDDWFYDAKVLKKINEVYSSREVWLTHGTLVEFPAGSKAWSRPIPADIVARNAFRTYRCPSHLRTFYSWLFKRIQSEDLLHEGQFFSMTWDQAMMFPMIEMAGERHAFIPEITYVYNISNPINDNKVDPQLQRNLEALIRNKPPYQRLDQK